MSAWRSLIAARDTRFGVRTVAELFEGCKAV
jgi:hypothetical protein